MGRGNEGKNLDFQASEEQRVAKRKRMSGIDRDKDAYDEGRRAAIRGEALNQYQPSYRRRPELWTRSQLGYLDAVRDMRRAKMREPKKNVR